MTAQNVQRWWDHILDAGVTVGAALIGICGGWDVVMKAVVIIKVGDWIAATMAAKRKGEHFDPEKATHGIMKLIGYGVILAMCTALDALLGLGHGSSMIGRLVCFRGAAALGMVRTDFNSACRHLRVCQIEIPSWLSEVLDIAIETVRKALSNGGRR